MGYHALLQGLLCLLHQQEGSLPLAPSGKPRIIMVIIFFLRDEFLSAPEFHINRITELIFFCIKLFDSTQCFCYSSLLLLLESIVHSFSLLNSIQLYEYNTVFYFLINGYLGYFQFFALLWHLLNKCKVTTRLSTHLVCIQSLCHFAKYFKADYKKSINFIKYLFSIMCFSYF